MRQLPGKQTVVIDARFVEARKPTEIDDLRLRLKKAEDDHTFYLMIIASLVLGDITTSIIGFVARWQWEVLPVLAIVSSVWFSFVARAMILVEFYRSRKERKPWTTETRELSTRRK